MRSRPLTGSVTPLLYGGTLRGPRESRTDFAHLHWFRSPTLHVHLRLLELEPPRGDGSLQARLALSHLEAFKYKSPATTLFSPHNPTVPPRPGGQELESQSRYTCGVDNK